MEYIVLDLEWNQSNTGKEDAVEKLPFEIIEIGAIKLNKERVMVSEFNELVKPQVYHEMHKITSKLIHIQMQELERHIEDATGFHVLDHELKFYGQCKECLERQNSTEKHVEV